MGNGISSPKNKQKNGKGAKAQTKSSLKKQALNAAATEKSDTAIKGRFEAPSKEPEPEPKAWIPKGRFEAPSKEPEPEPKAWISKPKREEKEPEVESKSQSDAENEAELEPEPELKPWAYRYDNSISTACPSTLFSLST